MTLTFPALDGLSWSRIRDLGRQIVAETAPSDLIPVAVTELAAVDHRRRMLAVYLLGFTAGQRPENLDILRESVVSDSSWEVQEVLAQAFDAFCAAIGYDAALPTIDDWLADARPNARRAVSEGLRPWTSRSRSFFARNPGEAIRRLSALRADPSDYVRHSAGNALRDIRRAHADLVDAEAGSWDVADPRIAFTFARVRRAR